MNQRDKCLLMKQIEVHCNTDANLWSRCIKNNMNSPERCTWLAEELLDCLKHAAGPLTKF